MERDQPFELIDRSLPLDGGVVIGETIKVDIIPKAELTGQRVIDVIKEYGEFIPFERKNDFGIAIARAFSLMRKAIRFCGSIEWWRIETFVLVYRFDSESNFLILDEPTNDLDIVTLNVLESLWTILDVC
jgi:ATP-binding cassette subfamily F protein uup